MSHIRNRLNGDENNNVIPATTSDENVSSATVQQSIEVIPLVTAGTTRFNVGTIPAGGSVQNRSYNISKRFCRQHT